MTSIIYSMSKSFAASSGKEGAKVSLRDILRMSPAMLYRVLKAKYQSRRDGTPVYPRDIFRLDGLVCVGTDTALYKDELEELRCV